MSTLAVVLARFCTWKPDVKVGMVWAWAGSAGAIPKASAAATRAEPMILRNPFITLSS